MIHPIVMFTLKECFLTLCCKCALGKGKLGGGSEACQAVSSLCYLLPPSSRLSPLLRLLDPHPDCKLSVPPCSLYSWLPPPAADRTATSFLQLQYQEEERGLSFQITSSWSQLFSPGKTCLSLLGNTGITTRGK
ncbi:hypothetical protein I79_004393 [Cricetulus griseus]|uniref:Uncharacterized protein n=1 Tax=Cricetulus griseus TaxID=10029 RepID=G3H2I0_CRIGR|nr:hypothetical protein I79_004393 [Cricetulus griseus]